MYKIVSWVYEMKNRKSIRNINRLQNGNKGGQAGFEPYALISKSPSQEGDLGDGEHNPERVQRKKAIHRIAFFVLCSLWGSGAAAPCGFLFTTP